MRKIILLFISMVILFSCNKQLLIKEIEYKNTNLISLDETIVNKEEYTIRLNYQTNCTSYDCNLSLAKDTINYVIYNKNNNDTLLNSYIKNTLDIGCYDWCNGTFFIKYYIKKKLYSFDNTYDLYIVDMYAKVDSTDCNNHRYIKVTGDFRFD